VKPEDNALTLPAASVVLAVNVVVDDDITVTVAVATPPAEIVVVATGDPVPAALLYTSRVLPASPVKLKVGVRELPGLVGVEEVIIGAAGAILSCVYENEGEQALKLPAASIAVAVKKVVELELAVTVTAAEPPETTPEERTLPAQLLPA